MLLFDQNLSYKLSRLLRNVFPACKHVRDLNLAASPDPEIWNCAIQNKLAIVTQDADFSTRSTIQGHPPKVIHLAVGNSTTKQISELLSNNQQNIHSFLENSEQSYLIVQHGLTLSYD